MINLRTYVQATTTFLSNSYLKGFIDGKIYTGPTKQICFPGLNCYSCPGALGACPIGAVQAVIGQRNLSFSYYLLGFFLLIGTLLGRFVCGWLCPFGWLQDLLYKIPFSHKLKKLPGDKILKYLKYVILIVFVIILPMFVVDIIGQGDPWFCKLICPSGTFMAGVPLLIANPGMRDALGQLFLIKGTILLVTILLAIVVYRPFCQYLCPLGAIYGLFNPISYYRYTIDKTSCTKCKACQIACPLDIATYKNPNSPECIRCGKCKAICPQHAIK